MALLCIDIGNTHTHGAVVAEDATVTARFDLPTRALAHPHDGLCPHLTAVARATPPPIAIAFCSVVPAANAVFRTTATPAGLPLWQLTHAAPLGVPITYPRPAEIGQDRLANAAGAHALHGTPAVVIDLGTAVTFDVITRAGGYEGGIIAPGPALMTRYLHERTAQLPLVEDVTSPVARVIGRSTAEAMRIGAVLGFTGLIQTLLDAVLAELAARGEPTPVILTSGGAAAVVSGRLRQPTVDAPDLTLQGLAAAWRLTHPH